MKYNRREIMKMAWQIRKTSGCSMSKALTTAWAATKATLEVKAMGESYCGHTRISVSEWVKYGKNRTYIQAKVYTNAWNLKREIKAGYIDNLSGEWVAA